MKKKYPVLKTLKKVINENTSKNKSNYLFFVLYTIIAGTYPLFAVFIPKLVIGELTNPVVNINYVIYIIVSFAILTALFGFFESYIYSIMYSRIMNIRIGLIINMFDKLNNLDYHYTEDPNFLDNNEDAFNATSNNENGFEGVSRRIFTLGSKIFTCIAYIIIIASLSYIVLLALLLSVIVSLLISIIIKKVRYAYKDKLANANRKIGYYSNTTHDFDFGKDIRLYNLQEQISNSYDHEIINYVNVFKKIKNKEYLMGFIELFFVLLSDSILYYVLITKVMDGMPIGDFSMYLLASIALSTLLKMVSEDISFVIGEGQYINDYYNFIETEFNAPTKGDSKVGEDDTLEIEFKNVSFKYPKTDKWIFKDLNLKIEKGEKLAIVGINGAGKTTFVKLLTRLFDPTSGEILVNGKNALEYDKKEYQEMFSTVFQDINILAFTIRENITLGLSDDEKRIWDVLEKVGLATKVSSFEKGLDQMMLKNIDEEGVIFSGGENQKLAIARALYKDGNMVVLDEPTAALDALAEKEIYENFNSLILDKTAIFISHRLASTKFCDCIALFNNSKLVEYGTHEELMELKGEYYNMFMVQGKYYHDEEKTDEKI